MALKLSTLSAWCSVFWLAAWPCFAPFAARGLSDRSGEWRAIVVPAADLGCLRGAGEDEVAILACAEECAPIPWQLDERDPDGELVLDRGPAASSDLDAGAVDANDELVFMWSDALLVKGDRGLPAQPLCFQSLAIDLGGERRWVYAARYRVGQAPRSPLRYVGYDVAADRMSGRLVDLTFAGPTPRGLSLRRGRWAGRDLLDRLKIRVSARFFGFFPLYRDETTH